MRRKSILITGAGSGIGLKTAILFARRGWLVGAADIDAPRLGRLQARAPDGSIVPMVADVTDREAVGHMVESFTQHTLGYLDVAFLNAGILRMGPFIDISPDDHTLMNNVNIDGILNMISATFVPLKRTPDAHLISMSSASAEYGVPELAVYAAAKAFVRSLTEGLSIEFAEHGITVSAITASYVTTPLVYGAKVKARSIERLGVKIPPQRVAETVWRAAHGRKLIWRVGFDAKLLHLAVRLFGDHFSIIARRLSGYS
ncbi:MULTISPECIES: SDR family NAD(P)-dependent oxidoreductase [Alphaproteobacteria]|uniref:SDR family NAD(P)-dependent oxidoreductase n=1 Tax=Alphaproteobacteria TaxID=28211 RepID=UPI001478E767|nr:MULTISPECIES: SDR family NAD(P)-dependent oxidoreductase [Alphaproteobacteria]